MKRVLTIIGAIAIIAFTGSIVVGVLLYTGVIGVKDVDNIHVYTYQNESGYIYTEAEWEWSPIEYKKTINYVDTQGESTRSVSVLLNGDTYYDITLPDEDYIYDYGKTIWAVDGSYMIRVVADATLDNLSKLAGIDNGLSLNKTTLCTQDNHKGAKTIVTLIDTYAIIANVYYGDDTYSIIRDSLSSGESSYELSNVSYADDYTELDKLVYSGNYVGQVVFQEVSLEQQKYMFADGVLWVSTDFNSMYSIIDTYLNRICTSSGQSIDETYENSGMFYAKSGDYYLGLISYNSNTTIVLLGDGEESKCNIISIMSYLR